MQCLSNRVPLTFILLECHQLQVTYHLLFITFYSSTIPESLGQYYMVWGGYDYMVWFEPALPFQIRVPSNLGPPSNARFWVEVTPFPPLNITFDPLKQSWWWDEWGTFEFDEPYKQTIVRLVRLAIIKIKPVWLWGCSDNSV